jgi:hypothetical protein
MIRHTVTPSLERAETVPGSRLHRTVNIVYNDVVSHFFHFSMYVNLVIGLPLTPHVPTPTRPDVESGEANILFFTLPLFVLEKTCRQKNNLHYAIRENNKILVNAVKLDDIEISKLVLINR